MKFFRIIVILFLFLLVSLTIDSCEHGHCGCEKYKTYEYSLSSVLLKQLDDGEIWGLLRDNSTWEKVTDPNVIRENFAISITFLPEVFYKANFRPVNSLFIQSAYACSCPSDEYYPKENIVSIKVFSDKDFGKIHPAGTNIAEFFKIHEWEFSTYVVGNNQFMKSVPTFMSFESYIKRNPYFHFDGYNSGFWARCFLSAITIESGEYEFRFVFELSDERTLEQSIKTFLE